MAMAADSCDHSLTWPAAIQLCRAPRGEPGMTEALNRLREAVAKRTTTTPLLSPFVGTGFSLAATGADYASWSGLLLEGIKVCQRVGTPMPSGWADRMREQLDNADVLLTSPSPMRWRGAFVQSGEAENSALGCKARSAD
jgi:hypothetical protein